MEKIKFIVDNFGSKGCGLFELLDEAINVVEFVKNTPSLTHLEIIEIREKLIFQVERLKEILDMDIDIDIKKDYV